jgi:hypothetical protein
MLVFFVYADLTANLMFMEPCIANVFLSTTNEMQRYKMSFFVVSALHVSSGFSAHHQELKNCIYSIGSCQSCVLLPLDWMSRNCVVIASLVESELSSDSTRPAVTTHNFDKYRCCIYSFLTPDDERKNRSKHVDHRQQ